MIKELKVEMRRTLTALLTRPLLQVPRPWLALALVAVVLATPGQSQLRLFDRRDELAALRSELSVLTSQLGAVEQVLSELLQGVGQPDNLLNALDQLNREDGFVLSATIAALQERLRNAEGELSEEEAAGLRLAYEEAQRRYVRVQSLRSRVNRQLNEPAAASQSAGDGGQETAGQEKGGQDANATTGQEAGNAASSDAARDQAALLALKEQAQKLTGQLARSQSQLQQAQLQLEQSQADLAKREAEAAELNNALAQTQARLTTTQTDKQALAEQLKALDSERQAIESELAAKADLHQASQAALAAAQQARQQSASELETLTGRLRATQTALERSRQALEQGDAEAQRSLLEREAEVLALREELVGLQSQLGQSREATASLAHENDALKSLVAERDQALLAARLAQAEIRDAVKAQVESQKSRIDQLTIAVSERDTELALARGLVEQQATNLQTARDELKQQAEQAKIVAAALTEAHTANAALEQALAQAKDSAAEQDQRLAAVEAEKREQALQLAALQRQLASHQSQAENLSDRLASARLALPEQAAWSFEATFGSLGHRLRASQKRALAEALGDRPAGGCLLISATADPRPIKPGYRIKTNAELASLRALSVLRGLQDLDPKAADQALILALSEHDGQELPADKQRAARLRWVPQACAQLVQNVPGSTLDEQP